MYMYLALSFMTHTQYAPMSTVNICTVLQNNAKQKMYYYYVLHSTLQGVRILSTGMQINCMYVYIFFKQFYQLGLHILRCQIFRKMTQKAVKHQQVRLWSFQCNAHESSYIRPYFRIHCKILLQIRAPIKIWCDTRL